MAKSLLLYMKRLQYFIFAVAATLAIINTACIEDSFTTSSSDILSFSVDTLAFDTVITETGTPTKQFIVYNRNKKMLNISSITLAGNDGGIFHLNVDGMKGESFSNVEVRGEDSIYVFVEAYVNPTGQDLPLEIEDRLDFVTNGVTQSVVITAWGQDVTRMYAPTINTDTHFKAGKPYLVFDTLTVGENATLTIDAGTTILFHDKSGMKIHGTLLANGTQDAPVTLRGDRLDNVVGGIDYDIMSGQWGGIRFMPSSFGNEMQYVSMRGSSSGVEIDSAGIDRMKLHIFNSVLHNSSSSVLKARHAWIEAEGSEFSDAAEAVVSIHGGITRFAQCTLANYYLFDAITGPILDLYYLLPEESQGATPLMDARFDNCILYGNTSDISPGDLTGSNVFLRNCLLRSNGSDDANFINCKWDADPKFFTVREEYLFDYRLKNESDAISAGDPSLCPDNATVDMYGVSRFSHDGIDIGAYTWVEQVEEDEDAATSEVQ